jgi:hypothetical protein
MPVILLTNLDMEHGLANGSRGHVVGFESFDGALSPQKKRHGERFQSEEWLISSEHTAYQEDAIHKFFLARRTESFQLCGSAMASFVRSTRPVK